MRKPSAADARRSSDTTGISDTPSITKPTKLDRIILAAPTPTYNMLTFEQLREVNVARCNSGAFNHTLYEWSPTDWSNAVAGEAGEACNVTKKMLRGDYGPDPVNNVMRVADSDLAKELADIIIYADLTAARCGIDLGQAVRDKFNEVSDKRGSHFKL